MFKKTAQLARDGFPYVKEGTHKAMAMKTRYWNQVQAALESMVGATEFARERIETSFENPGLSFSFSAAIM